MGRLLLWTVLATVLLSIGAQAQDLTGAWQGTLTIPNAGRELRIVVQISKEDTAWRGMFYSIDQSGQGIPINALTLQGSAIKMTIPNIGGSYEGRLEADANTITGTFTQGGPIPLVLRRATPQTAWEIPKPPAPPKPMAADAKIEFEVATIKLSKPETQGRGITLRGKQIITINTALADLLVFAYGIHPKQLANAPAWAETERYDITALPVAEGTPSVDQLKTMVKKLITERFGLAFHLDKKEQSVYAITVGKTGSKLTKTASPPGALPGLGFRGLGNLVVVNGTMPEFAETMQSIVLDRPVVDQTGLQGRWDFTLQWKPDEFQFTNLGVPVPPAPADSPLPNLFTAIQDQLGLRLEATRAEAGVFVIDKVSKPTEN
jgi:uncharacterized protein (TIGR03435 family)